MPLLDNTRWELFAQARALDGLSPKEAYLAIGGTRNPSRNGRKLGQRPEIKERIRELLIEAKEKRIDRALYTKTTVISGILEQIEAAKEGIYVHQGKIVFQRDPQKDDELVLDDDGEPIPVEKQDHRAVLIGWELLGKELGMFVEEHRERSDERDPMAEMSLEEILTMMRDAVSEASDGRIQLDTADLLRQLFSSEGARTGSAHRGRAEAEPARALQAASEAAPVPCAGEDEA